jgi:hypothetical protein
MSRVDVSRVGRIAGITDRHSFDSDVGAANRSDQEDTTRSRRDENFGEQVTSTKH